VTGRLHRRAAAATLVLAAIAAGAPGARTEERRGFSVEITEPVDQEVVLGRTKIAARVKVADPSAVSRVEFAVGDDVIFIDREPPYECWHDFGDEAKSHVIRAVAYHVEEVSVRDVVVTRRAGFVAVEQVNRVILWVAATDKRGEFVLDLTADDFRVFENDVPQEVLEFYREDGPLTLAFLLDSSGSMRDKLSEVHAAASAFVETLRPADRALVIDFDERVFLIQELTSDHAALKEAIASTEAIGGTAIYDALHAAYRKIGALEGRKAIVLLTDGEDFNSQFSYDRVLEEAKSSATLIYSIAVGGDGGVDKGVPKAFSDVTGGQFFYVRKADELSEVYQRIAEELRAQFFLAYSTTNQEWDGRWMKLRVESLRPDVKLRARRGYFAVR